jgi:hypothetical protein
LTKRTIKSWPIIVDSDNKDQDAKDNIDDKDSLDNNSNNKYPKTDDKAKEYIFTAIEQRIKANNAIVVEKMV